MIIDLQLGVDVASVGCSLMHHGWFARCPLLQGLGWDGCQVVGLLHWWPDVLGSHLLVGPCELLFMVPFLSLGRSPGLASAVVVL